jgi:hypothetical protein
MSLSQRAEDGVSRLSPQFPAAELAAVEIGSGVVNLRAELVSVGSSHSPQKRHLRASSQICSLQNGHGLNAPSSMAQMFRGP